MPLFLAGNTSNKMATSRVRPATAAEAQNLAEMAYDHAFEPSRWHLGKPADSISQQYYRASGNYDPQNEYPGPDGILRLHNSETREIPEVTKLKLAANENRTFASMFDGSPDLARAEGVRRLLNRISPANRPTQDPINPANDNAPSTSTQIADNCSQEWNYGLLKCLDMSPRDPMRGGHLDPWKCAAGFVSERCGGNAVKWK